MSLDQRIDEYIDRILKASGSAIKNYTLSSTIVAMRYEVRAMCIAEYMKGSEERRKAVEAAQRRLLAKGQPVERVGERWGK